MFRSIAYLAVITSALLAQSANAAVMGVAVQTVAHQDTFSALQQVHMPTKGKSRALANTGKVELAVAHDVGYMGEVTIGTPPQKFNLLFGSGSNVIWVPNAKIGTHAVYNSAASSTYVKNGTYYQVVYDDETLVSGFVSVDTINIGGLTVPNVKIMEAANLTGFPSYVNQGYDGIFGLGMDVEGPYKLPNPVQQLAAEGKLDKPQFAFYLGSKYTKELSLGGVNHERFSGDLNYVPVISTGGAWWIEMDGVKVGDTVLAAKTIDTIVDSGSLLLYGPTEQLDLFGKATNATKTARGNYQVDCKSPGPAISFKLGGKEYKLEKKDYLAVGSDGKCYLAVGSTGDEYWILGVKFMEKIYTVYDFGSGSKGPSLGFAPAV